MKKGKVLAVDYGTKHIGLATGDLDIKIAFPRDVFENKEGVEDRIFSLCEELGVRKIVVGLPLSMREDQKRNFLVEKVEQFVDLLQKRLKGLEIDIELFDERLSSFEAEQLVGKDARTAGERLDAHAAQVILQRYFDTIL